MTIADYISAQYSSKDHFHKLYVNGQLEETVQDDAASTPVTLDSARIGSWLNLDEGGGHIDRGLHGEISVFRIWNIVTDGQDVCPPAQTPGLIASYVFGHSSDTLLDLSGNIYDGLIHDADWSNDLPPSQQCQRQGFGGFFDGDSDYVALPRLDGGSKRPKRAFDILTIDTWIKFFDTSGNHPIMNEDGWGKCSRSLCFFFRGRQRLGCTQTLATCTTKSTPGPTVSTSMAGPPKCRHTTLPGPCLSIGSPPPMSGRI